jgi:ABC-type polysaccharide/polyol phosphate transport system ATPase subunit
MRSDIAISVKNLTKTYRIFGHPGDRIKQALTFGRVPFHREFTALKDVSFEIKRGETVGIIGRNGSGKSTLLQLICGILKPTSGSVQVNGRISALLELGAGFNPEFTGRENVYFQGAVMGFTKAEMDARFDEITAFADIGEFIDQQVRTYSSGMFVRLAFAVNAHMGADVLLLDEALAVGDAFFQAKCMSRMKHLVDRGTTILFVSHDINSIKAMCQRTLLLEKGSRQAFGETGVVARVYAQDWVRYANAQRLTSLEGNAVNPTLTPSDRKTDFLSAARKLRFSARSGTGHAQYVTFLGFCGCEPMDLMPLEFGSSLRLVCLIEVMAKCDRLTVGIHIKDRNNQHLVGINSGALVGLYDRVWQQGEKFQVEFQFPVHLHAGRYAITALISSLTDVTQYSDVKFIDWLEDVGVFEVAPRYPFPLSDWIEIEHQIAFSAPTAIN